MHGWYLQERRRAVTWTRASPGTRWGERSLRRGRGTGLAGDFRGHDSSSPEPLPNCLAPTTPHLSQGRGLLVPAAGPVLGGEGPSLLATQNYCIYLTPPHAPLTQPSWSPACARRCILKVLCWGDPKALYRHWSDGSLPAPGERKEATGSELSRGGGISPRGLDQSQVLEDPRKGRLSAPGPNGSSLPPVAVSEWERGKTAGTWAGDGAEAVQVWGKDVPPTPRP